MTQEQIDTLGIVFGMTNHRLGVAEAKFAARAFLRHLESRQTSDAAGWLRAVHAHTWSAPTVKVGTLEDEQRVALTDPLLAAAIQDRNEHARLKDMSEAVSPGANAL